MKTDAVLLTLLNLTKKIILIKIKSLNLNHHNEKKKSFTQLNNKITWFYQGFYIFS
jgi:hypothetical protein